MKTFLRMIIAVTALATFVGCYGISDDGTSANEDVTGTQSKFGIDYSSYTTPSSASIVGAWDFLSMRLLQVESINGAETSRYDTSTSSNQGDIISRFNASSFVVDGMEYPYTLSGSELHFDTYPVVDSIANGSKSTERYQLYISGDTLIYVLIVEEIEVWGKDTMAMIACEEVRLIRSQAPGIPDYELLTIPTLSNLVGDWAFSSRHFYEAEYGATGELIEMYDTLYDSSFKGMPISFTDTTVIIDGLDFECTLSGSDLNFYLYPYTDIDVATGLSEYAGYNCYMDGDTLVFAEISKQFKTATGMIVGGLEIDEQRYVRAR